MKPGPAKTASLPDRTHQQLSMYALAATAAGVGILPVAQPTHARIVYTPAHKRIGPRARIALDLNHDGATDFTLVNSLVNHGTFGRLSIFPSERLNGFRGQSTNGSHIPYASALVAGVPIGPREQFVSPAYGGWMAATGGNRTHCFGPWANVSHRYLGVKFAIHGKVHFGWARLNVVCKNTVLTATLTGYAYETIPGKPIITGRTKGMGDTASVNTPGPEPATLGVLAMGAPGLSIWRPNESATTPESN